MRLRNLITVPLLAFSIAYLVNGMPSIECTAVDNSQPVVYTVRKGDSLSRIAKMHGIGYKAIMQANGLGEKSIIHPGQKLTIPTASKTNVEEITPKEPPKTALTYDPNYNNASVANRPGYDFQNDSDYVLMLRTIYGEFRGRAKDEVMAGIECIVNRAERFSKSLKETILKENKRGKHQFSCYDEGDPNRDKLATPIPAEGKNAEWERLAEMLKSYITEPTHYANGANHYFHRDIGSDWLPYWAEGKGPVATFSHGKRECLMFKL